SGQEPTAYYSSVTSSCLCDRGAAAGLLCVLYIPCVVYAGMTTVLSPSIAACRCLSPCWSPVGILRVACRGRAYDREGEVGTGWGSDGTSGNGNKMTGRMVACGRLNLFLTLSQWRRTIESS